MKKAYKTAYENEKKVIEQLKRYKGKWIIRIDCTKSGDYSKTTEPVLITGFTSTNRIKCKLYRNPTNNNQNVILPREFTDDKWILYEDALKSENNPMNELKGKLIIRIRPTERGDERFTKRPVKLISASKNHVVVSYNKNSLAWLGIRYPERILLGSEFSNPEDWLEYIPKEEEEHTEIKLQIV